MRWNRIALSGALVLASALLSLAVPVRKADSDVLSHVDLLQNVDLVIRHGVRYR